MKPSVLIGIPTLNDSHRLQRCLSSIHEHGEEYRDFEHVRVLVADDGSLPSELKLNMDACSRSGVEMLYGQGRTGIASTWNRLVRQFPSDVVVLVNDDIEVVSHWLDVLVYSTMQNKKVGMVGLNTYCGVTKRQIPEPPRIDYHEARLMGGSGSLVSSHGPIFAFRREVYDEIGGFDQRYFAFYEEVDFGVRLRQKGYLHYMASYPLCYHMGGATNSNPRTFNAERVLAESKAKFLAKWGKGIGEFRDEFLAEYRKEEHAAPYEWNTQIKAWK